MKILADASSVALAIFLGRHTLAQQQAPQPAERFLAEHHVEDSPAGLRAALANSDREVRGVAAALLAQRRDIGSIPLLKTALAHESRIEIKVALAGSLNDLGDTTGHTWLVKECRQVNAPPLDRMLAAIKLLDANSNDCASAVLEVLGQKLDHDTTSQGLLYLRRSTMLPADSIKELRIKLEATLSHSTPEECWNASRLLAVIGDSTSIAPIQRVIHDERNGAYRSRLEDNLHAIKLRLASGTPQ